MAVLSPVDECRVRMRALRSKSTSVEDRTAAIDYLRDHLSDCEVPKLAKLEVAVLAQIVQFPSHDKYPPIEFRPRFHTVFECASGLYDRLGPDISVLFAGVRRADLTLRQKMTLVRKGGFRWAFLDSECDVLLEYRLYQLFMCLLVSVIVILVVIILAVCYIRSLIRSQGAIATFGLLDAVKDLIQEAQGSISTQNEQLKTSVEALVNVIPDAASPSYRVGVMGASCVLGAIAIAVGLAIYYKGPRS
jgi:uncharacterized membrane protein